MRQTVARESRTEINKDISRIVDSLSQSVVRVETARLLSSADLIETSLIVFDTSLPADSSGHPPVKAVIRQTARHEEVERDTTAAAAAVDTQVTVELTDKSAEESVLIPAATYRGSWWKTTKKVLIAIAVVLALTAALWGIYKLIKFFKK